MDADKGLTAGRSQDPRAGRGRLGERLARLHLEDGGYDILQTNFRTRYGEIDIIAQRGAIVAFVEVKARRSRRHGEPFEAVGFRKQNQIRRMAEMWVAAHNGPALSECSFRFDVASILLHEDDRTADIEYIEDAFR